MRFDRCAATYEEHALPQKRFAARVAAFACPGLKETMLEFGAGTGILTRCLLNAQPGCHLAATDVSPAMVELGRAAAPQASWSVLDAFAAELPSAHLQVSSGLLQWAPAPVEVLRHWKEALLPAGRMVHAMPVLPCLSEWRELAPCSPLVWRTVSGWKQLFEQAGLEVRRHELWVEPVYFSNALELARSLHHSGVTGSARLSPAQLRQVLRSYDQRFGTPRGICSTWAWLALEATAGQPGPDLPS